MASTFTTWFRRSRTTLSDKHFKVIFNNIDHSTFSAKNHKTWLKQLETLHYAKYSMLSQKHNAKHAWRIGTLALSTARAGTSYEMIRQRTRSTSNPFLISPLFRTFTSGRADHTVTGTERKKVIKNTTLQINSKRSVRNDDSWAFTIDLFVIHGSEKPCWNSVALKKWPSKWTNWRTKTTPTLPQKKNSTYIVAIGGYVRICGSDTMPIRHRLDFKEALSTLHRLKKAEDQAYYHNWWQSSSSSWWQWQDSWWHPSSETSPRRWTWHWSSVETFEKISESSIYLWNESHNEFGAKLQWSIR